MPGSPPFAAIEAALAVYEFAFGHLGFAQSYFEVRKGNDKVVRFHKRFGATITGEDALHFYFRLTRAAYPRARASYEGSISLPAVLSNAEGTEHRCAAGARRRARSGDRP